MEYSRFTYSDVAHVGATSYLLWLWVKWIVLLSLPMSTIALVYAIRTRNAYAGGDKKLSQRWQPALLAFLALVLGLLGLLLISAMTARAVE